MKSENNRIVGGPRVIGRLLATARDDIRSPRSDGFPSSTIVTGIAEAFRTSPINNCETIHDVCHTDSCWSIHRRRSNLHQHFVHSFTVREREDNAAELCSWRALVRFGGATPMSVFGALWPASDWRTVLESTLLATRVGSQPFFLKWPNH